MLNGKYVGLETIVERVYRDTGFTVDTDWVNIAEWIGDAIDLANTPMQYKERITDGVDHPFITIVDGRGELPCDLRDIIQTRMCDGAPLRYSTDSFHFSRHAADCVDLQCRSDLTYKVNDNYIFTNFDTGEIEMAYHAFPVDDRGFPLIPDDEVFKQMVVAYVAERIGYKLFLRDKLRGDKYRLLQQERAWYMGKAQTKPLVPNRDKMESIGGQFRRLVTFRNESNSGFRDLGKQQVMRNHTGYRS